MAILSRLMPDAQKVFLPELARFARNPRMRDTLRQSLDLDPNLHGLLLHHLASNGADANLVLQMAGARPPAVAEGSPDWRTALVDSLIRKGEFQRARQQWARFSGVSSTGVPEGVYDGDFQGLPGLPPFNWSFASSELGAAERDRKGALQVEYYGRTRGDLAWQLLMLPPGRYRMSFHAEGDLASPQHRLIWRMQCQKNDLAIMEFPLTNISYAGRRLAGDFTVPPACNAQWLKLVGEPTEFPKIENVLIRNLLIQQIGRPS
jgi:hypothetical protein